MRIVRKVDEIEDKFNGRSSCRFLLVCCQWLRHAKTTLQNETVTWIDWTITASSTVFKTSRWLMLHYLLTVSESGICMCNILHAQERLEISLKIGIMVCFWQVAPCWLPFWRRTRYDQQLCISLGALCNIDFCHLASRFASYRHCWRCSIGMNCARQRHQRQRHRSTDLWFLHWVHSGTIEMVCWFKWVASTRWIHPTSRSSGGTFHPSFGHLAARLWSLNMTSCIAIPL